MLHEEVCCFVEKKGILLKIKVLIRKDLIFLSMERSSLVSVAAFDPGDLVCCLEFK